MKEIHELKCRVEKLIRLVCRLIEEKTTPQKGEDGKDGKDGPQGPQGPPGINGKDGRDGRDGVDGKDGVNGKDGADGKDGPPGPKGEDGDSPDVSQFITNIGSPIPVKIAQALTADQYSALVNSNGIVPSTLYFIVEN